MELHEISGIGKTRLQAFENAGILSCRNLLSYFPRKYYNFGSPDAFVPNGEYKMIRARVIGDVKTARIRKNFVMTSVKLEDSEGNVFSGLWYNQPYVKSTLVFGDEYFVYGRDDKKRKNTLVVSYFKSTKKADGIEFFPIYKSIDSVGSEVIRHAVSEVLKTEQFSSVIPMEVEKVFNLESLCPSFKNIHMPATIGDINRAKSRIALENLVPIVHASKNAVKIGRNVRVGTYKNLDALFAEYKTLLPFDLTPSQNKAIEEIICDLESGLSMNRLLEGDVGSGKTAVATFLLYVAAKNNMQAVLMAPTEILARQHFEFISRVFEGEFGINVVYLSSSMPASEKKRNLGYIKYGMANIIIGSHSVFSKSVEYNNLGAVIIDEQHKFGVKARAMLQNKGRNADTLTMSATPIPRSLALSFEGCLDISILNARPNALSVTTNIVSQSKSDDMWNYLNSKIKSGSKVFVVCPKIESGEDDGIQDSSSAESMFEFLKDRLDTNVVLVHGKMDRTHAEEKIKDFKSGGSRCLVSTTIVEVGVDAKDADIMVIENAGHFGLASLHQLRGRVGRDGKQAECYCVVANDISKLSLDRLRFFKNNTDGFKIAEYDLETRGAGDMEGTQQHGFDANGFDLFSLAELSLAKDVVQYMTNKGLDLNISEQEYQKALEKIEQIITMN